MGVLDMFDPEVIQAMKGFGPSDDDKKKAMNMGLLHAGLGVLAGNRGYGQSQALQNAIGMGGIHGLNAYDRQINDTEKDQMRQLQTAQMAQGLVKQKQMQQTLQNTPGLPDEVRSGLVPYQEYWKNKNQAFNLAPGEVRMAGENVIAKGSPKVPDGFEIGPDGQMRVIPAWLQGKKEIAQAGRAVSNTNVNMPPMESEEQKALGKDLADQYSGIQKAGLTASGSLNNLGRMKSLLTGIETGRLTPAQTEVASVLDSLGIKIDKNLPQKQAAAALSNELALRAKNQGGENLMPGAMSDPDRRFLVEMVPGLANTPGGNAIILETLTLKAQRDQEVAKMARDYRNKNKTLNGFSDHLAEWSAKNPLFDDLQKKVPAPAGGGFKIIGVR